MLQQIIPSLMLLPQALPLLRFFLYPFCSFYFLPFISFPSYKILFKLLLVITQTNIKFNSIFLQKEKKKVFLFLFSFYYISNLLFFIIDTYDHIVALYNYYTMNPCQIPLLFLVFHNQLHKFLLLYF